MRQSYFLSKVAVPIFFMILLVSATIKAQEVSGTVTDLAGNLLPAVNVIVTGQNFGTTTDFDGNYTLQVPEGADGLTFSSVGYVTQSVAIDGRSRIDINLEEDVQALDEVIVTGYSTQQKRDVTASIATVDVESFDNRAVTNAAQALQGTAAGVHVASNNGNPGSGVNLTIRGISSFGGNNSPLIIIDGVQTASGMDNINPNDVESIQILKDASAAAIYGSRGANGVILIKTKMGDLGKTTVTYSNYVGIQIPRKALDLTNSQEYVEILQRMYGPTLDNQPGALIPQAARDYLVNPDGFGDYDWQDLIYSAAPIQYHDLTVSGGSEKSVFRVSASYLDQEGVTAGTAFNRVNIRANALFNVNDNLKIGTNIAMYKSKQDPEADAFSRSIYQQAIKLKPYFAPTFNGSGIANPAFPDTNPDGDIQTSSFYFGGGDNPEALIRNPLHYLTIWDVDQLEDEVSINLFAEIDLFKGLTYKISGSYSQLNSQNRYLFGDKGVNQGEYFNANNAISESFGRNWNWNVDNTLRYSTTIADKHNLDILAGYISQKFNDENWGLSQNNYIGDVSSGINTIDAPGGSNPSVGGSRTRSTLESYVAQVAYAFDDKYLLSGNFRRDGSSRFSNAVRWGNFAGGSIGWRLSNENFWKNSGLSQVNDLKLRAGYGVLGRQNVEDFAYTPVLQFEPVVFGDGINNGLITGTAINSDLTWEKLESTNFGLDFEMFNSLGGSIEYYRSVTTDMIIAQPVAPSVGGGTINRNSGKITNSGVEITLNYRGSVGTDFTYNAGFNLGTQDPKLDDIGTDLIIYGDAGPEWDVPHVMEVHQGGGLSEFWVIKTDGLFRSDAEVQAHQSSDGTVIQPDAQPGDIRFVDANDNGRIDSEGDRQLAGSGVPNVNVGLNLSAKYKNFDVTLNLTGAFGHEIYNSHLYLVSKTDEFGNYGSYLLDAFDPVNNPDSNVPRLNPNDIDDNWNARPQSDRFIEDADYVKVRNLELGYTLPASLTDKLKLGNARIFVRGQNIWTITGYSGIDPEIGSSPILAGFTPFTAGLDRDVAPQVASIQGGVKFTF